MAATADAVLSGSVEQLAAEKVVGISLDDGTDHDYLDFSHPDYGHLRSMARVLREHGGDLGHPGGQATATSFVIVSPDARAQLDRSCIAGRGQWRDAWWEEAAREGVLAIANHSWDHLHPTLDAVVATQAERGRFDTVTSQADAEREIGDAERYLQARTGGGGGLSAGLFAYPYGHHNDFLVRSYLPAQEAVRAAFVGGGDYVRPGANRWAIPRFICQEHWQAPDQLERILAAA